MNKPLFTQRKHADITSFGQHPFLRCFNSALVTLVIASALPTANAAAAGKELFGNSRNAPPAASVGQAKRLEHLKKERTTAAMQLVHIDLTALTGDGVKIPVSPTEVLTYVKTHVETRGPNNFTWFGSLPTGQGDAILVVRNGVVTGTANSNNKSFKIEFVGEGGHAFIEINTAAFPDDHPSVAAAEVRRTGKPVKSEPISTTPTPTPTPVPPTTTVDGKTIVDIMVVYPQTVANAVADVTGLATLAVAQANQVYVNSGVNIALNLVGTVPIPYNETGVAYTTLLSDLAAMPDVKLKRDSLGADIVIMLTNNQSYCGYAYLLPQASMAVGVVTHNCVSNYSFAHEVGHIQGLNHDPVSAPTTLPFAYGHGFQSTNSSPSWRTVMAYNCTVNCARVPYFSNPNLNYNGLAMGTPTVSNNARVLNETAASVSAFRPRLTP